MENLQPGQITQLLEAVGSGDTDAHEQLWMLLYEELHTIAQRQMGREAPGRTLQPTALVHEAYLRLFGQEKVEWANRRHFFAAAAKAMRHVRIDSARKRKRQKRGGSQVRRAREPVEDVHVVFDQDPTEVLAVDEALERLRSNDPVKAEIVQLRYFAGMTIDETAEALEVSPRKVDMEWRVAKAWLHRELSKGDTRVDAED